MAIRTRIRPGPRRPRRTNPTSDGCGTSPRVEDATGIEGLRRARRLQSPRWLLSRDRIEEARQIVSKYPGGEACFTTEQLAAAATT